MITAIIKILASIAFIFWVVALIAIGSQLIDEYKNRKY